MKKFVPLAVAAAMAIVPASAPAQALQDWGGWQNQHSDNVASPACRAQYVTVACVLRFFWRSTL